MLTRPAKRRLFCTDDTLHAPPARQPTKAEAQEAPVARPRRPAFATADGGIQQHAVFSSTAGEGVGRGHFEGREGRRVGNRNRWRKAGEQNIGRCYTLKAFNIPCRTPERRQQQVPSASCRDAVAPATEMHVGCHPMPLCRICVAARTSVAYAPSFTPMSAPARTGGERRKGAQPDVSP